MPGLRLTLVIAIAAMAQPQPAASFKGRWRGSFETPHGTSALSLSVDSASAGYTASFELELMGTVRGFADSLAVVGDSLRFILRFETDQGGAAIRFRGRLHGDKAAGLFRGSLGETEMSAGPWSLERAP